MSNQDELTEEHLDSMKLCDLFDLGWKLQRELSKSTECESSSEFIKKRQKAILILKKAELMLDELHLFSDNEDLEEVSTSELR
jgi:immunoglobulin-binding protein 1